MITDIRTRLSDQQAVTVSAFSTNWYDNADARIGSGRPVYVRTTIQFANDQAVTVSLAQDSDAAFATPTVGPEMFVIPAGAAGREFVGVIPPNYPTERYIGASYDAPVALTTGLFTTELTDTPNSFFAHRSGFVVQ
jgi:hypothetical protein